MVLVVCTSSDDALYVCEVHENFLNGIQVIERHKITTVKFQRGITPKLYRHELRFLWIARRLMMLYTSMKFREDVLNGF